MSEILLGCDPELFVRNTVTGQYRSGHDLIPGTKDNPYMVKGGAIQVDGVACEFNTNPASTREEFLKNILQVRSRMEQMVLSSLSETSDRAELFHLAATPTAFFDREYFDSLPEEVRRLGCTPDFDAYTEKANKPPETTEPFRTGSGHIHIGWGEYFDQYSDDHLSTCRDLVKQLDAVLFPLSYLWDADEKRRELYGKKGSFRPKTYGVEYRPLSNAWLNSKENIFKVFDTAKGAVELYFEKGIKLYEL